VPRALIKPVSRHFFETGFVLNKKTFFSFAGERATVCSSGFFTTRPENRGVGTTKI
jgi:hypothetical protein